MAYGDFDSTVSIIRHRSGQYMVCPRHCDVIVFILRRWLVIECSSFRRVVDLPPVPNYTPVIRRTLPVAAFRLLDVCLQEQTAKSGACALNDDVTEFEARDEAGTKEQRQQTTNMR